MPLRDISGEAPQVSLLRFVVCGSVDCGKSTLIGRLLHDCGSIADDQLAALKHDSRRYGTTGDEADLALLLDGLQAEREQGITIDVAYRYFGTAKRQFIVADAPGHVQYTRNMASGASNADLAVLIVDARHGLSQQTRRHAFIASLFGIDHIVLVVNKIDLVGYSAETFEAIASEFGEFAAKLGVSTLRPIPVSARLGDNVVSRSQAMTWYDGPTLLEHLETVDIDDGRIDLPFRLPVQYVNRPNADFRGFAGLIASGKIAVGDDVVEVKNGRAAKVTRILVADKEAESARQGEAVTLILDRDIEIARGNMLAEAGTRPEVADQFAATILWFDENEMLPGRSYLLRTETDQANATISELKYRIDVDDFGHDAAKHLSQNEIGVCNLSLQTPIAFDPFDSNRVTGAFILIDRTTNDTVAAGMIAHSLRRADNIPWQALEITKQARAAIKRQKPLVIWFTGLSGAGKSTIANLLEKKLHAEGRHTYLLDGDNVRHGLNRNLGFTAEDRVENIRRAAEVAKLMADAGLIVLASFISPFRAERKMARDLMAEGEFVEVFVDTPFEECARRDPKGLYAKAIRGEIANFTGLDSPYEAPDRADIHLTTSGREPEELVEQVQNWLAERLRLE